MLLKNQLYHVLLLDGLKTGRRLSGDGAVNKVFFSNKYEDLCFVLPDTGHMYYIREEHILFRKRYWVENLCTV